MTMTMTNTKTKTMKKTNQLRAPSKSDPSDLRHLRHWLHFSQLRTWILYNLCCLTIKSDTGQHSQFLRCFLNFSLSNFWQVIFTPARSIYAFLEKKVDWYLSHKNMIWSGSKTNFALSECQSNVYIFTKRYLIAIHKFIKFTLHFLPS